MPETIITGVKRGMPDLELKEKIKETLLAATDNLTWLKPDELVLLKPALNSPDPYPATTHPMSIQAVVELLRERGARVVVADQAGIGHVVHGPKGKISGSTRECFEKSGMKDATDVDFVAFEEEDWTNGFHAFKSDRTASWKDGYWITNWIDKADHILNLPRLSTHAQAGVTLGFKNLVGLLREDSRLEFHLNGPFSSFVAHYGKDIELTIADDRSGKYFEKITEIAAAVQNKLLATLFVATKAQTTFGPDAEVVSRLRSHVEEPETGLIIASADMVAAESAALAFLILLYRQTGQRHKIPQTLLEKANGRIRPLGSYPVKDNEFIRWALEIGLGENPEETGFQDVPTELAYRIEQELEIS